MITWIVCIIAGMGAGISTGLAGLSAAAVISPMLITLLGFQAYDAIGIALASDVLASALSAYTYYKNKNIDISNGTIMMVSTMLFTLVGSYIASFLPQSTMGDISLYMTALLGVKFLVKPVMETSKSNLQRTKQQKIILSILCGVLIGLICGIIGAGGGMMLLIVLTSILGYNLKMAVGTSVMIMSLTALTGAISHFTIGGFHYPMEFTICVVFTLVGAWIAAKFANKADMKKLNQVTGIVLLSLGILMIVVKML